MLAYVLPARMSAAEYGALAVGTVTVLGAVALLIIVAVESESLRQRPSIVLSTNDAETKVSVEATAYRLPNHYYMIVTVKGDQAAASCSQAALLNATLGPDSDGDIDYKVDIPVEETVVTKLTGQATIYNASGEQLSSESGSLVVIAEGAFPTTTTSTTVATSGSSSRSDRLPATPSTSSIPPVTVPECIGS